MYRGGDLSTKGRDLSTEGETRLLRGRLVYGGGDSSRDYTRCYWECPEWPEHSKCRIYVQYMNI